MNEFDALFSLSGLSLDRLRTFLLVAEAGNLANAAKGDVTRQSQFSRQKGDALNNWASPHSGTRRRIAFRCGSGGGETKLLVGEKGGQRF